MIRQQSNNPIKSIHTLFLVSDKEASYVNAVHLPVLNFVFFQKRGFESAISNLSDTTKCILLDSPILELTVVETQIATCPIRPSYIARFPSTRFYYGGLSLNYE